MTSGLTTRSSADTPALSRQRAKLEAIGATIAKHPPSSKDHIYTHPIQCQVGLPRRLIPEREFVRQSGNAWISVQAGYLDEGHGPIAQPLPYGPLPRMILAHLTTQAMRSKTRQVSIGRSASSFLRAIGMSSDGRRHRQLITQIHAFVACRIQYGFRGRTYGGQPIEQFDALTADEEARPLRWPGVMTLSQSFVDSLKEGAVPLDRRAMNALMGSALKLDIYAWLAHRLHRLHSGSVRISWRALRDQFAQEYIGKNAAKDFRATFLCALQDVLIVYPAAKVKVVIGGIKLYSSATPIPTRASAVVDNPFDTTRYPREIAPTLMRVVTPVGRVKLPPKAHVTSPSP